MTYEEQYAAAMIRLAKHEGRRIGFTWERFRGMSDEFLAGVCDQIREYLQSGEATQTNMRKDLGRAASSIVAGLSRLLEDGEIELDRRPVGERFRVNYYRLKSGVAAE